MRSLIYTTLSFLIATSSFAKMVSLEDALETQGLKVEYIASSERGLIYVQKCEQCSKKMYAFNKKPIIIRQGIEIPFDIFLSDYWNAKFPTLFLDPKTKQVLRIKY